MNIRKILCSVTVKYFVSKEGFVLNNRANKRNMKNKYVKKIAGLVLAVGMVVSATTMPVSASSVSGFAGKVSCSGSNYIDASGAGATTYAGSTLALHVFINYQYAVESNGTLGLIQTLTNQNSNNAKSVSTRCNRPSGSNLRSYRCWSTHTAAGDSTWKKTTGYEYYK